MNYKLSIKGIRTRHQILKQLILIFLIVVFSACSGLKSIAPDSEQLVMSTLWYQHSAEMRAIYYQSFQLAELRVKQMHENHEGAKPLAVVVDIDETMLDNSPSEGRNILEGERYSKERWMAWTGLASAEPLPGSLEFAHFLEDLGVELFYISNRSIDELDVTIKNLIRHNFPFADKEHVFLKSDTSSKKSRREKVAYKYEIALLIGDNLGDFSEIFDDRSDRMGKGLVDQYKKEFGKHFIVLPNPIYGSWTSATYGSTSGLSPKEIAKKRKIFLSDY